MLPSHKESNVPYVFLENIHNNLGNTIWFVLELFTPFGIPLALLKIHLIKRGRDANLFTSIVQGILFIIPIALGVILKIRPLFPLNLQLTSFYYLEFCILSNMVTLLATMLSAGYESDHRDAIDRLENKLGLHSQCIDKLLGEKMWAGEKTHALLKILNDKAVSRSKWAFINFIAEVVDDTIDSKADCTVKTITPWSPYRYSQFLADNISHSQKSVWWLIDPEDFFCDLLPYYCTCVIISYGWLKHKYKLNLQNLQANFTIKDAFEFYEKTDRLQLKNLIPFDGMVELLNVDKIHKSPDEKLKELHDKLFPAMANKQLTGGISNEKSLDKDDIINGYNAVLTYPIIQCLPHIEAFRAYSGHKYRAIYLGGPSNLTTRENIKNRTEVLWKTYSTSCQDRFSTLCGGNFFEEMKKTNNMALLIEHALHLHSYTCGGEEYTYIVGSTGQDNNHYHDTGIYDERFLVTSEKAQQDRSITWKFCMDTSRNADENRFFIDPLQPGVTKSGFSVFIEVMKEVVLEC